MGNVFPWQGHEDNGSIQSHTQQSANITVSENKESQTILTYQDLLINAISSDTIRIAGVLKECEFISDETFSKNLNCPSYNSQEKATILVNAVREKIKTAPKRFPELIRVLLEQASTKNIAEMLQSAYQDKGMFSYFRYNNI